jgi:hypothetical protein
MGFDLGRFKRNRNDEWLDWLADEPVPASVRAKMRTKAVQEASRPVVRRVGENKPPVTKNSTDKTAAVSIHVSIPKIKIKRPDFKIPPQLITYKKWIIGGVAGLVLIGGITGVLLATKKGTSGKGDTPAVLAEYKEKADFPYSLPKGSDTEIEGEVRYNPQRKLVNFKDSIGGVVITISQQPLPEGFKEDTDTKVKKLAQDFNATKTIATANPTSYIGTSAKGPQTVIFSKKDLLVFIQSTSIIDDHDWAEYITNLK